MAKRGLGKGIDALFGDQEEASGEATPQEGQPPNGVLEVPLAHILAAPGQPRRTFDEGALYELSESLKRHGVLQPIIVRRMGRGEPVSPTQPRYVIVAGERRYRAARLAGFQRIPVLVREMTGPDALEVALVENLQREDLSPVEEAEAYRELMERRGVDQRQVAELVGKSRSAVANSLRLLKLPEEMLCAVDAGEVSPGHARALLSVVSPGDQKALFRRILEERMSVREAERLAEQFNLGARAARGDGDSEGTGRRMRAPKDPNVDAVERLLMDRLGTKVELRGKLSRGKIEIHYYSRDDLDRVIELLTEGSE